MNNAQKGRLNLATELMKVLDCPQYGIVPHYYKCELLIPRENIALNKIYEVKTKKTIHISKGDENWPLKITIY